MSAFIRIRDRESWEYSAYVAADRRTVKAHRKVARKQHVCDYCGALIPAYAVYYWVNGFVSKHACLACADERTVSRGPE